jgi:hypothetical protein
MGGLTNDVRRFWWAVLAIALLTIVTRLPSLLHPQAIDDEETYSVVENVIVYGGRPYVDAARRARAHSRSDGRPARRSSVLRSPGACSFIWQSLSAG